MTDLAPTDPAPAVDLPPTTTDKPWYEGADSETIGNLQTRGWDKLTPGEAIAQAVKAHKEAEKFIGAPATQLARIPTDPKDEAGWKEFRAKIGVPSDPTQYDFSAIKKADGTDLDATTIEELRGIAANAHLPKDAATNVAAALMKREQDRIAATTADSTAALEVERTALKDNWKTNYDTNMVIAKNAAMKLGVKPEQVTALEKITGYAATMELFRQIGTKIGEDQFITNLNPATPGVMTRDQAVARKSELMADNVWSKRYLDGDVAANRELQALLTIISGDDTEYSRRA